MKFLLPVASSAVALALTTMPALAQSWWWWRPTPTPTPTPVSVPEIDGSTSLLALAAIGAAMLFVWDRNRRRIED